MKQRRKNPPGPAPKSNGIKVLLVDDSPLMLQILVKMMAKEPGFEIVGTATDGRQAVLLAASLAPQLVLMDLHLPHLNGAQATRCLKQFENPPIVFIITSDERPYSHATSTAAGADAIIVKSGNLHDHLKSKLQEWFRSGANSDRREQQR
jgi:DNA-binding NarL/FixJ family response regulator